RLTLWSPKTRGLAPPSWSHHGPRRPKNGAPMPRLRTWRLPLLLAPGQEFDRDEQAQLARSLETLTPVQGLFQSVLTQASREATHDSDRAAGQTVDVVPDGAGQVAEGVARQQSFQSWSLEQAEKRSVSDLLPTNPLALSGKVLQMLRLGMH